ncbi:MAG TPA: lysophospholipid acyltransferase family protein [Aggregatilineales bacterium]|nr:1-acyl-sn-glycerol-3-phosphate acyltransferase [Anaerolineales bacterium]HRE46605.1 lysophospholipid acyltransferase family protein [Aggregatilineales bacterium]
MTLVSADFAFRQDRYRAWRYFIRDVLLRSLAFHLLAKVEVRGFDHIPLSGGTIVLFNHIDAIDPVVILGVVRPRFAVPMSKVENFSLPIFGTLMKRWGAYPVHRDRTDKQAVQNTISLTEQGHLVLIAPEGTRSPALIRGKDGAAFAAVRTGATIVPAAIDGTPALLSNLKRLRRTPITITFGRAFRFNAQGDVPRQALTVMTDEAMYRLAALLPPERRGVYSDLDKATTKTLEFLPYTPFAS